MWHVIWSKSIWMFATHKVQSMSKVQHFSVSLLWLHCLTLTESLIDQIIMENQVTKRTHSTITTSDLVDSLHGKSSHEMDYHSTLQTNSGHINYDWLWITFLVVQCSDHCQSATAPGPGSDSGQALLFICQQCDPFSSNTVVLCSTNNLPLHKLTTAIIPCALEGHPHPSIFDPAVLQENLLPLTAWTGKLKHSISNLVIWKW